jgi:ectoine hydroxylase-related dioxygenase (phytanoyl-CoA dioxygenase family)
MSASENGYRAGTAPDPAAIHEWVAQFDRDGYLFLPSVLPPDWCAELRDDLDRALAEEGTAARREQLNIGLVTRMFERSRANLRLFDVEPIVTFAETLIGRDESRLGAEAVHVIHNNSFVTEAGGGITTWHQDDPAHFKITHGEPPTNIRLPVLLFTANYYLTDVTTRDHGGTECIPGSHLFGAEPPKELEGTPWEELVDANIGPAGSVVMFNSQVWHRGGPNRTQQTRYITQVSYARRLVGHKYFPFMNYNMPEHVYAGAGPRLRRLLGFLPSGAYG